MAEPIVTKFCVIYDGEEHQNHEMDIMTAHTGGINGSL